MKKVLCLTLLVAAFGAAAHPGSMSPAKQPAQVRSTASSEQVLDFRTGRFVAVAGVTANGYYPECATMDGGYCSTVGARARCYWYGYSEPGLAICQSNHTWAIY
jgi:hypothetical protein